MSQRLIKPGLRHPHTGELVRAIGYRRNGTPIWPVLGASPDDEGDGGGDGGDEDGGDDEGDGEEDGADDASDDSKGKSGKKDDDEETVPKWRLDRLQEKFDKTHLRMTNADRRRAEVEKLMQESKDVNPELRKELEAIKAEHGPVKAERDQLRMQVAFLTSNTIKWKDAEAALKLADLSEVEFDDNGRVDKRALKAALNDLAKAKPWLVDTDGTKDTGGDTDNGNTTKVGTAAKNGRRKGEKDTSGREALAKRFPVLNR